MAAIRAGAARLRRVLLRELMRPVPTLPPRSTAHHGRGFGMTAFAGIMAAHAERGTRWAPKAPHFPPKAKHVIFIFLTGGLSAIDSFDRKPLLDKYDGKPLPYPTPRTEFATGNLMRSPFEFTKHGQNGTEVSEIFPNIGGVIDDFCQVRSMVTDIPNHGPSMLMMNTGSSRFGTAVDGLLDRVRARHGESEPARVSSCSRPARPARRRQPWGVGFPAGDVPGHARSRPARPTRSKQIEYLANPALSLGAAAAPARPARPAEPDHMRRKQAPELEAAHPVDGGRLPHADRGAGRVRHPQGEPATRSLRRQRIRHAAA